MLQWVNPKAWAVALAVTVACRVSDNYTASLPLLTTVFGLAYLPSIGIWVLFRSARKRLLNDPSRGRLFNFLMVAPHVSTIPGFAIMVAVLGFNLLGDGLRDALDPKMKVNG